MEASRAEGRGYLDLSEVHKSELIGFAGSAVLALSLFLPWFETNPGNANANINGAAGEFNAWETFGALDWLLLAACIAPFVLAWIIARGHALTWRPGEVTMIVGMVAFMLIILNGIILGKPGEPDSEISRRIGWYLGLVGAIGIGTGGIIRQAFYSTVRKPPGVM